MTTTLNTVPLPDPHEVSITSGILGSTKRAANGTIMTDFISTVAQKKISLSWRLINSTQRDEVVTQCQNAIGTARNLVLPGRTAISVYMPADSSFVETQVASGGSWLYNLQVTLMEDLRLS